MKQAGRFLDYSVSQKVKSCREITLTLINSYINTLAGYTYKTVEQNLCSLRAFFRFLYRNEIIDTDFSAKIPMIQARKQTRIPSVWSAADLKKLIEAIDRGSPMGKRDYAIIILACRLGLRCADIKTLKMEDFHWEDKKQVFVQSKTRTPLSLPLTPEVGWVVIDYLKYGRHETKYMPHIYSYKELKQFFAETEKCHYSPEAPYRHLIMPVFFRMVYTCGFRVSEARLLQVDDYDFFHYFLLNKK